MVQVASVGPMFGQLVHFTRYAPAGNDYSVQRYTSEVRRIFGVLDRRLAASACLGGEEFSVADVATWPWIRTVAGIYPFLHRRRPAGQRAGRVAGDGPLVQHHQGASGRRTRRRQR